MKYMDKHAAFRFIPQAVGSLSRNVTGRSARNLRRYRTLNPIEDGTPLRQRAISGTVDNLVAPETFYHGGEESWGPMYRDHYDKHDGWNYVPTLTQLRSRAQNLAKFASDRSQDYVTKVELLKRADRTEPFLRGMVNWNAPLDSRRWLYNENTPAGFITLTKGANQSVRVGAVYVAPEHRGKGLASSELKKLATKHRLEAFINADNEASQRLFEKAGLFRGESFHSKQAGEGYWYRNFNKQYTHSMKHIIKTGAFRAVG